MGRGSAATLIGVIGLCAGCVSLGEYRALELERDEVATALEAREAQAADVAAGLRAESEKRHAAIVLRESALAAIARTHEALTRDLETEVARGSIRIEQLQSGVTLRLSQEILFESGSARLDRGGRDVLYRVAERLEGNPYQIVVVGYSDDTPIGGRLAERYPTNWELAAARAAQVVRLFEQAGIASARLTVGSFGEQRPIAPNDSAAGRAQNRRIEIRLRPVVPGDSSL